jgi:hypothetical protein
MKEDSSYGIISLLHVEIQPLQLIPFDSANCLVLASYFIGRVLLFFSLFYKKKISQQENQS